MPVERDGVIAYKGFELRIAERLLIVQGRPTPIGSRAFDLMVALVERDDRVVSKLELLDLVWSKVVVEDNNLQVHIHALRKLLGASVITTVPGRGYRFTAERLAESVEPAAALAMARPPAAEEAMPARRLGDDRQLGNLPNHLPPLYGRERDLLAVRTLLGVERLVTISGAGGIGKTRLAQAVAHDIRAHFPQGVWMMELAWTQNEAQLAPMMAQMLGLTLPGRAPAPEELVAALEGQSLLLLLDNCEHLLDAVGELAHRLMRTAPSVRVLVTSQELLRLAGENVYKLAPLAIPLDRDAASALQFGAVRLFVERARALDRGFALDEKNVDAVVDICQRLDGLALAIELAAARVPQLGVFGIVDRLGERFRVLTGGARVSLRRHQTMRAALDWSHHLLSKPEQIVFRRLGLFSGGFFVELAQSIACDDAIDGWAVLDHLSALVDKSLVVVEGGERLRYRLLESSRVYAMERLAEAGETDEYLGRHAAATRLHYDQAVKRRDTEWLWSEISNLRAAYAWALGAGDAVTAIGLATSSAMLLAVSGLVSESMGRLLEVQSLVSPSTPPALAAQYWQWLGRSGIHGRLPTSRCIEALRRAATMFQELKNMRHVHACLRMQAEAFLDGDDLPQAEVALAKAQEMETPGWPVADRLRRLRVEGLLCAARGEFEASLTRSQAAYELACGAGIERYELICLGDMARVQLRLGRAAEAADQFRALASRATRDRSQGLTRAHALAGLTAALIAQGEMKEAMAIGLEAVPLLRRSGIFIPHGDIYAWLLAHLQRMGLAAQMLGSTDAFHRATEIARDDVRRRAREEALSLLGMSHPAGQISAWMSQGAAATEEALAEMVTRALDTISLPDMSIAAEKVEE